MSDLKIIPPRPKTITIALRILWGSLVLDIPDLLLNWNYNSTFILQDDIQISPFFDFVFVHVCTLALCVWIFFKISRGRNWARITYLIVTIFSTITFITLNDTNDTLLAFPLLKSFLTILEIVLDIIVLYLLFSNPGSAWFKTLKDMSKTKPEPESIPMTNS
jgi:hypothetical protein